MPSLTPQIDLVVTLQDFQANVLGSVGNPAYVRIALAGYGPFLPRVSGTSMIVGVGPIEIPYEGESFISIQLWGNDVITPGDTSLTPGGTYYVIELLDANRNVLQSGAYQFTGIIDGVDLSTFSPYIPNPVTPTITGGLVTLAFSATPIFECSLIDGPIAFDLTLTGNVASSTLIAAFPGQIVTFFLSQDATGNWDFAWPSNVENAGLINDVANSVSTQTFVARANGNLYPIGPMTYS